MLARSGNEASPIQREIETRWGIVQHRQSQAIPGRGNHGGTLDVLNNSDPGPNRANFRHLASTPQATCGSSAPKEAPGNFRSRIWPPHISYPHLPLCTADLV
jgi:hypothetical protein